MRLKMRKNRFVFVSGKFFDASKFTGFGFWISFDQVVY